MILSFHPCLIADKNIICAGRKPNKIDITAIKKAKAIILPQGCSEPLYRIVSKYCSNVFPNFDLRFRYPGKTGQIKLFKLKQISHPKSWTYSSVNDFLKKQSLRTKQRIPFVLKFDWGGEGQTVFLVKTKRMLNNLLDQAQIFEKTGHFGFLIQEYIQSLPRTLRVVVIGKKFIPYWKIGPVSNVFGQSIATGAQIKKDIDSSSIRDALNLLTFFCNETGINLAGFDLLFSEKKRIPLLLEINYFFGRRGLGGSEEYYKLLYTETQNWIKSLGFQSSSIKLYT